jgi:hypothetical protein
MMFNLGWGFKDLIPYFRESQSHTPQDNDIIPRTGSVTTFKSIEGPIKIFLSFGGAKVT